MSEITHFEVEPKNVQKIPMPRFGNLQKTGEIMPRWLERQENRRNGIFTHVNTGITTLDTAFEGTLEAGDLIVLAARPSMAKSAFLQQILESVAAQGDKSVVFISAEMSKDTVLQRSIMRRSGVSNHAIRNPVEQTDSESLAIAVAGSELQDLPMYLDCTPVIEEIAKSVRELHAVLANSERPLKLIGVDYLQYLTSFDFKGQNENILLGGICRALSRLGKELSVPVIVLAQLNRSVEERPNKRPVMSDIRGSGNIEQDADVILTLYRDEYYNPETKDKGIAEISCIKCRNGSLGTVKLRWSPERLLFSELNADSVQPNTGKLRTKTSKGGSNAFDK